MKEQLLKSLIGICATLTLLVCGIYVSDSIQYETAETTAYVIGVHTYEVYTRWGPRTHKVVDISTIGDDHYAIHNNRLGEYCEDHTGDALTIVCDVAKFHTLPIHTLSHYYVKPGWLKDVTVEVRGIY